MSSNNKLRLIDTQKTKKAIVAAGFNFKFYAENRKKWNYVTFLHVIGNYYSTPTSDLALKIRQGLKEDGFLHLQK